MEFDPKPVSAWPRFALPENVGHAAHNVEVPLEVLQEALKAVLMPGGRIRAVRPMASSEESEETPAEAPPSASAS
jgi:hypothetical protein